MDQNQNRRADDRRPALPLRWGERFTLLLTCPNAGVVGAYGATWPGQPVEYERVNVCVEGAQKLDDIEQYRLQMAGISTAALGYWKEGDTIHPDYDTPALRDVARLYAKYDELFKFRESVRAMVRLLKNREWAEDLAATGDAAELQGVITELVGTHLLAARPEHLRGYLPTNAGAMMDAETGVDDTGPGTVYYRADDVRAMFVRQVAPDAVDQALADAVVHGTGTFRVNGDGSTERVDWQRDALHPGYAAPKPEGDTTP